MDESALYWESGWLKEWLWKRDTEGHVGWVTSDWISIWVNEWVNELVFGWLGGGCMSAWSSEWYNVWATEWLNMHLIGWLIDGVCVNGSSVDVGCKGVNKWVFEWVNEQSDWMDDWLGVRVSEWVSELLWVNDLVNDCSQNNVANNSAHEIPLETKSAGFCIQKQCYHLQGSTRVRISVTLLATKAYHWVGSPWIQVDVMKDFASRCRSHPGVAVEIPHKGHQTGTPFSSH